MKNNSKSILGIIFIIWFVLSFAAIFYTAENSEMSWLMPVIFGQYFLGFGLFITFGATNRKKSFPVGLVLMILGAAVLGFSLCYHYGNDSIKENILERLLPLSLCAVFFLVGLVGVICTAFRPARLKRRFTLPVNAVCVDILSRRGSNGGRVYCPVYAAFVGGKEVTIQRNVYTNIGVPKIGDERQLFISEKGEDGFYDPKSDSKITILLYVIFGMFALLGLISMGVVIATLFI